MKTLNEWLDCYTTYHQNPINIGLHIICVPLIFWSVLGLIWLIPVPELLSMFPRVWVKVFILLGLFFYWPLSQVSTVCMLLLGIVCLISFYLLQQIFSYPLLYLFVLTFVLSGIGLFIGYRIEDKKPAFMQKIFFFLIGPIWILQYLGVKVSD